MNGRPVYSIADSLGKLSRRWLSHGYSFRREAVKRLTHVSGFSERMAEAMIEATFSELTPGKIRAFLRAELKNPLALDAWAYDAESQKWLKARGPKKIFHIFSSNIPNAAVWSFVSGLLLKSSNVGKLSRRDGGFLEIYLKSLKTADLKLWRHCELIRPDDRKGAQKHLKESDLVVAYGSDESLTQIRNQVPGTTPFCGYGHRVSAAVYLKEALTEKGLGPLARATARDLWMADQRGCLSPVAIYIQKGGRVSPEEFSRVLAACLKKIQKNEKTPPKRDLASLRESREAQNRQAMRQLKGKHSLIFQSNPPGRWTVSYDETLRPVLGSSSQTITVQGFKKIDQAFKTLSSFQKYLQCIALECVPAQRKRLAEKLSEINVNRVCRAGKMQNPPLTWHHDGKPTLAHWIQWTDLE